MKKLDDEARSTWSIHKQSGVDDSFGEDFIVAYDGCTNPEKSGVHGVEDSHKNED